MKLPARYCCVSLLIVSTMNIVRHSLRAGVEFDDCTASSQPEPAAINNKDQPDSSAYSELRLHLDCDWYWFRYEFSDRMERNNRIDLI